MKSTLKHPILLVGITLSLVIILSGCGPAAPANNAAKTSTTVGEPSSANPSAQTPGAVEHLVKLTLYFPTPDADGLAPVERSVNVPDEAVIKAIFKELQNPPSGLEKPLPEGTQLLGATVKDGVATLNLSKEFRKNFNGGSTGEQMILFSIIDSLTALANVQSVQFLLEGKTQEAILGHLDTTEPLKRNEKIILKQ
ncbi:MAG: GerMN domain-containing protein [Desulfitobacteriaceae bacterium]|nr:GerMN domain-containing protein [Desulfitobacteriaceae bacterium]MDI6879789.1 GerMN domain-containing protein [Desulfitobacteriaceae bacterium]MDI6915326.1 GerMN domain-containing protein [Desulfitobacteriaceae bacterium]